MKSTLNASSPTKKEVWSDVEWECGRKVMSLFDFFFIREGGPRVGEVFRVVKDVVSGEAYDRVSESS